MLEINKIYHGDCLEVMKEIDDKSIDLILCDLPYGTTQCCWDTIIPFEPLWKQYKRIIKDNSAIVLFGAEPFSSLLRCSNLENYKYDWVWKKDKATGHLNAKKMPMRLTERISVFYSNSCTYNPQFVKKDPKNIRPATTKRKNTDSYGDMEKESSREISINKSYPSDILEFRACFGDKDKSNHPTEKPVPLFEYLIKTYTNENALILDNCAGSGTTGVAAKKSNRNFILIEKEEEYVKIAERRIYDDVQSFDPDKIKSKRGFKIFD